MNLLHFDNVAKNDTGTTDSLSTVYENFLAKHNGVFLCNKQKIK